MTSTIEELNFKFYQILINLNEKSHTEGAAIVFQGFTLESGLLPLQFPSTFPVTSKKRASFGVTVLVTCFRDLLILTERGASDLGFLFVCFLICLVKVNLNTIKFTNFKCYALMIFDKCIV